MEIRELILNIVVVFIFSFIIISILIPGILDYYNEKDCQNRLPKSRAVEVNNIKYCCKDILINKSFVKDGECVSLHPNGGE
jgi:hypothetical protein